MPRPTQSQGRPGTAVIPAGWSAAHGQVVTRALVAATVAIGPDGGTSEWSEGDGRMVTVPATAVYTGAASIMAVSDTARILTAVSDPTSIRVYDITLPHDGTGVDLVKAEHTITITTCDDGQLVGKTLAISGIERGTQRFSRVLLAVLND